MNKYLYITTLLLFFCSRAVFAQFFIGGKVEYKTMPSKILNEDREYAIFLPKGYEENTDRSYPVLYLLHGGGQVIKNGLNKVI